MIDIGMNNQLNLMDNTALNIKNIIQPYENKIRDLEEIIKQKDFEIIVLKQKLNNIPKNNFMNMNINLMNPMMDIMNQNMNMNIQPMMNQFKNRFFENKKITLNVQSDITDKAVCFLDARAYLCLSFLATTISILKYSAILSSMFLPPQFIIVLFTITLLLYIEILVVSLPIFIIADTFSSKFLFLNEYISPILLIEISTTSIPICSSNPNTE